jgi:hypothetical protein
MTAVQIAQAKKQAREWDPNELKIKYGFKQWVKETFTR